MRSWLPGTRSCWRWWRSRTRPSGGGPRRARGRARGWGGLTTAPPPPGVTGGPVCYGPNVVAAATLLASTDVIGVERAADLMAALLQEQVSTGFVSRCLVRLDVALTAAGFEDALKDALRAADVLGTDETPA